MKNRVSNFLSTSLLLALTSCDGGSLTASEAMDEGLRSTCAKAFDCMSSFPTDAGFTVEQLFGSTEAMCVQMFQTGATEDKAMLEASISAGRIKYNADDAQACLD